MSKMEINVALERIKIATVTSPILVLTCGEKGNVMCFFANTIESQRIICRQQPNVIGIFDSSMDFDDMKKLIKTRVRADYSK